MSSETLLLTEDLVAEPEEGAGGLVCIPEDASDDNGEGGFHLRGLVPLSRAPSTSIGATELP